MNTNFDINVEIERLYKLCASKSIDNNTLLLDMKKIKKNKDITTIYKYGFNSLQDAVALAKVILRKKKLPKVESMLFNSDESSDVTSLEVDSYHRCDFHGCFGYYYLCVPQRLVNLELEFLLRGL